MESNQGRKLLIIRRLITWKLFKEGNYSRTETIHRITVTILEKRDLIWVTFICHKCICLICSNVEDSKSILFTGPNLPMRLHWHAMVQLGNKQAIIGGYGNGNFQDKIHLFSCTNRNCSIHQLDQVLSLPRLQFVAIPIPDTLSGCITGGKNFRIT